MSAILVIVVAGNLLLAPQLLGQIVIEISVFVLASEQRLFARNEAVAKAPSHFVVECSEDCLQLRESAVLLQGRRE